LTLLKHLVSRELNDRYRGSVLGFGWAFVLPLAMVAVYTFVFGFVFRARWGGADDPYAFALFLYCGLVPYLFVADALGRAPTLLLGYGSLVKKVSFRLPLLAAAATVGACVHLAIGFAVLIGFAWIAQGSVNAIALLAPLAAVPLVLAVFGLVLVLSSSGVFFRDLAQAVAVVLPVIMFLSPVFYPISAVPPGFRAWMNANPLTGVIENVRALVMNATLPDAGAWLMACAAGALVAAFGLLWFRRLTPGFADSL
jgi:lipopolysaccharide transport system permease protein